MSKYRVHKGVVQSVQALLCAIEDRIVANLSSGMTAEQKADILTMTNLKTKAHEIVSNEVRVDMVNPMHLEGYHGDQRAETANVVIPRSLVNQYMSGGASNDVGFVKTDDGFDAIISQYDQGRWWNQSVDRFWQMAATHEACEAASLNGYTTEIVEDEQGNVQIFCESFT